MIVKHLSRVLKIEEFNVNSTGTKGALAKAIYTMHANAFIYEKAVGVPLISKEYILSYLGIL